MDGGYNTVLRRYFDVFIEYTVQEYLKKFKIDVGQVIAVKTGHPKVHWLIVTPKVSVTGERFSGYESVFYACAYNPVRSCTWKRFKCLGMTGLGSGVGGFDRMVSARQ